MKRLTDKAMGIKVLTILLAACFIMQASATNVFAAYTDQSGSLPGMDDSDSTNKTLRTSLLVAGVVAVGGLIYYLVTNSDATDTNSLETDKVSFSNDSFGGIKVASQNPPKNILSTIFNKFKPDKQGCSVLDFAYHF